MRFATIALPLLLAVACSGGGGGGSDSAPPPPPPPPPAAPTERAVSGLSPFAVTCGGAGGVSYVNAEVEPYIAVNPRDANHMIAVWQQDRWSNGSARGLASALSLDGGTTWTRTLVPFSHCSGGTAQNGGDYVRATDPWVTFSPDGTAYQMALATTGGSFAAGSVNAMTVSRSADGGRSWSSPVALIRDTTPFFNDKNAITADPTDARYVYAVWDRLRQGQGGPTMLARTLDGGATWEPARAIHDPGPNGQTIGNVVRVLPNGVVVNAFVQLEQQPGAANPTSTVRVIRSTDKGATWSAPIVVSSHQALGARDPVTGRVVRDGSILPQMAAGPDGTLHVVWQDARFTGQRDAIAYSRSGDGGLTWSAPARVNSDPSAIAFTPQVHVLANGTIGVTFYDLRSRGTSPTTMPTEYWIARSTDGVNWSETRLAAPFDLMLAPEAGGLFLGDYTGLEGAGTSFVALYARTTGALENRTDVFVARVPPATSAAQYAAPQAKSHVPGADLERGVAENIARSLSARRVAP